MRGGESGKGRERERVRGERVVRGGSGKGLERGGRGRE